jgi:hypothetical protein
MFGIPGSYRTEHIDFNVAYINLPYNAILGYPALARFMAATHHAYNVVKMSGLEVTSSPSAAMSGTPHSP